MAKLFEAKVNLKTLPDFFKNIRDDLIKETSESFFLTNPALILFYWLGLVEKEQKKKERFLLHRKVNALYYLIFSSRFA